MKMKHAVYGTRDKTAKQLAQHLAKRCARELLDAQSEMSLRVARHAGVKRSITTPAFPVRYVISRVNKWDDLGSHAFDISEQHWRRVGNMPGNWMTEWVAAIVVGPDLDVELVEVHGDVDRSVVRSVLSCALRGRDR